MSKKRNKYPALSKDQIKAMGLVAEAGELSPELQTDFHLKPNEEGGWEIMVEGKDEAVYANRLKQHAMTKGRLLAMKYGKDLVIYRRDQTVQNRLSYQV